LIVKTFGLSQLIYSMQATFIREPEMKKIEEIIYKFIWNLNPSNPNSNGKIKREILQQNIANGGLLAPNVKQINSAIKLKFLLRCKTNPHPVSKIISYIKSQSEYVKDATSVMNHFKTIIYSDLQTLISEGSKINKMYANYFHNLNIKDSNFININQTSMMIRVQRNKINTIGDIILEKQKRNFPSISFEIHQLFHSIPLLIRNYLKNKIIDTKIDYSDWLPYKLNIWKRVETINCKDLRIRLTPQNVIAIDLLTYKHKSINAAAIVRNPFTKITNLNTTKLQDIQYKILHNIYPTMQHLKRWAIVESDKCETCNEIDDLRHTIFNCTHAQGTLINLKEFLVDKLVPIPNITYETLLLGFESINPDIYKTCRALDTILILLKRTIILQRNNKFILDRQQISTMILNQMKLEKAIMPESKFRKKWSTLVDLLGE
jgi:hypothetical protein